MTMIIFMSRGYFHSKNCQRELRAATAQRVPLILVHEIDQSKGFEPVATHQECCPEDVREYVFHEIRNSQPLPSSEKVSSSLPIQKSAAGLPIRSPRDVIKYYRLPEFQLLTVKRIIEQILLRSPAHTKELSKGSGLRVRLPEETDASSYVLSTPLSLVYFGEHKNQGCGGGEQVEGAY